MTNLQRLTGKIFGETATATGDDPQIGQFGSALAGTYVGTTDVATIQDLPAWSNGFIDSVTPNEQFPPLPEMTGFGKVLSHQIAYILQKGVPEWDTGTTYYAGDFAKGVNTGKLYISKVDSNINHELNDSDYWEEFSSGGGLEIGDIGIAPLGIDETQNKRRYLNGQVIIQDQFVSFTNKLKNAVTLDPSIACTEAEWQTAVVMSPNGTCGKFVIDDTAGTIRLPKYPEYCSKEYLSMPIVGNGMTLGLTNGTTNYGLSGLVYSNANNLAGTLTTYGAPIGSPSGTLPAYGNISLGVTQDATKSGIEVDLNSSTSELIACKWFIQVATGVEESIDVTREIELNNPFCLLDYKYSEYELNNISWLRSNGQYNSKATYPDAYDLLLKIYNGTETKAGVSVKLSTETFADTDFVLNTTNETFRLPLLSGSEDIISDRYDTYSNVIGGNHYIAPANGWFYIEGLSTSTGMCNLGLTDVNAPYLQWHNQTNATGQGLRGYLQVAKGDEISVEITNFTNVILRFVYATGNGSLYFYVGETVQNANLINAGRIEEKIVDIVPDNSSLIAGYAMPSNTYKTLTIGASGTTYTAPANGYYYAYGKWNANAASMWMVNTSITTLTPTWYAQTGQNGSAYGAVVIPVKKNDVIRFEYYSTTVQALAFIFAQGSESEAS